MDLVDDDVVQSACETRGHDEDLVAVEDGLGTFWCRRCGAEWWEDVPSSS